MPLRLYPLRFFFIDTHFFDRVCLICKRFSSNNPFHPLSNILTSSLPFLSSHPLCLSSFLSSHPLSYHLHAELGKEWVTAKEVDAIISKVFEKKGLVVELDGDYINGITPAHDKTSEPEQSPETPLCTNRQGVIGERAGTHKQITSHLKPPHYYVPPSHHIISQTTTLSRTTLSSHHISNHHTIMYHPLITSHLKPPHYHINTSIEYTLTPLFNTTSILYSSSIGGVRVTDQVHPLKPQWSQLVVRVLSMRSFRGGNSKTSYSIWALQWRVWYVYLLTHTRIHLPTHL